MLINTIKISLLFCLIFNFSYSQELIFNRKVVKQNLFFQGNNSCEKDSNIFLIHYKNASNKTVLYNLYIGNNLTKCLINNQLLNKDQKYRLEPNGEIKIIYKPLTDNLITEINFLIERRKKKEKITIYILSADYVILPDSLLNTNEIIVKKQTDECSNNFIFFPVLGSTTCITLFDENNIIFTKCYNTGDFIFLSYKELPKGKYIIKYNSCFVCKEIILLVQ